MLLPKYTKQPLRILDFDIENRPLSYLGQDFTTTEIIAIACQFADEDQAHCWLLGRDDPYDMLLSFSVLWDMADVVTGHYIRNHDLPIISGALVEYGLPELAPKMTSCTKNDLIRFSGLSKSQEALAAMFGLVRPKVHMNTPMWRESGRLTEAGLKLTEERVIGDVKQHLQLREELVSRNLLKPPRMWSSLVPVGVR